MESTNWTAAMQLLLAECRKKPDPLYSENLYQVLVKVVLAAQDSDARINKLAPAFFKEFPDLHSLSEADTEQLMQHLSGVRFHRNKILWLQDIAGTLKNDKKIPTTMKDLTALRGVGRKSANVIIRAAGAEPEGIMVDLHVIRVAIRLGIASGKNAIKIEKELMQKLPKSIWAETGSALSYLGRNICRPSNPKHELCALRSVCAYCLNMNDIQT